MNNQKVQNMGSHLDLIVNQKSALCAVSWIPVKLIQVRGNVNALLYHAMLWTNQEKW